MKFERGSSRRPDPVRGAWIAAALLALALLAAGWLRLGLPRPVCVFREWTGVPCATCGSTRMVESLLSGDIGGALAWNPLAFSAMLLALLWWGWVVLRTTLGLRPLRIVTGPRERALLALLAAAAVIAGWALVIWRAA